MTLEISLRDGATPAVRSLLAQLSGKALHRICASAVRVQIRQHLAAKQQQPNKHNWPHQGWYARARESVVARSTEGSAVVVVALEGFAARFTGNPSRILPRNVKALTIPMCAAAYGRRAGEFQNLHFEPVLRGRTIGFLVAGEGPDRIRMYRLVKWVRNVADPSLLPTEGEMKEACVEALGEAADLAME